MKTLRKLGCFLLALMLMLPATGAVAEEEKTELEKFQLDWLTLVNAQNDWRSQAKFALETILKFTEEKSWESLIQARAAAFVALQYLQGYSELPIEPRMTADDYQVLMDQGMDVGDLQAEINMYNEYTLPDLQQLHVPFWNQQLLMGLLEYGLTEEGLELLKTEAKSQLKQNELYMRYTFFVCNYILLELPEDVQSQAIKNLETYAPAIMESGKELLKTSNDVQNALSETMDELEKAVIDSIEALALNEAQLDAMRENEEFTPLAISGIPENALEIPYLMGGPAGIQDYMLYWKDENGVRTPKPRQSLTEYPNTMAFTVTEVTQEEMEMYIVFLTKLLGEPALSDGSAAKFILPDETELFVMLEDGCLTYHTFGSLQNFRPLYYSVLSREEAKPQQN